MMFCINANLIKICQQNAQNVACPILSDNTTPFCPRQGNYQSTILTSMITNQHLGILLRTHFRNGHATKIPPIFFRTRCGNEHVGHTHIQTHIQPTTSGHPIMNKKQNPRDVHSYHSNRIFYQTISPEFEFGKARNYLHAKNQLDFRVGHSSRRPGKQVTTFSRHTKTLVGKFGKITDPKIGGI